MYTDDVSGLDRCLACDLTEFNSVYALLPNRCSQCADGVSEFITTCKYCDIGFLGSTSNPLQCELKCDDNQYPTVNYKVVVDNVVENQNAIESTVCMDCHGDCATC